MELFVYLFSEILNAALISLCVAMVYLIYQIYKACRSMESTQRSLLMRKQGDKDFNERTPLNDLSPIKIAIVAVLGFAVAGIPLWIRLIAFSVNTVLRP